MSTFFYRRATAALILLLCLLAYFEGNGQTFSFSHLSVENGLSDISVMAIAQDSQGFIWLGTTNQLNRYDGYHIKSYAFNNSDSTTLSDNRITVLLNDSRKNLWVGTSNQLNRYIPGKDCFERIPLPGTAADKSRVFINALCEDRNGTIWAGTVKGLFTLPSGEKTFKAFTIPGIADNKITCMYADKYGGLWMGTSKGVAYLDKNKQLRIHQLSHLYITAIKEDLEHHIWIGTQNGGLLCYDPDSLTFTTFTHSGKEGLLHNSIRQLLTDKEGKLWIGTQDGLNILAPGSRQFVSCQHNPGSKESLSQNSVYSLFEDKQGSIWVGTFYGAANIAHRNLADFRLWRCSPTGLSSNIISSFATDNDRQLWIGTEGGGVNCYNPGTGHFTIYRNNPADTNSIGSDLIKVIYTDKQGIIWIGTHGGGLNVFDPVHRHFRQYLCTRNDISSLRAEVSSILEDEEGRLWAWSTTNGLTLFQKNKDILTHPVNIPVGNIPPASTVRLFQSANKQIWATTPNGLYLFSPGTQAFVPAPGTANTLLENADINCIRQSADGTLWLGLNHAGLAAYHPSTKTITLYTQQQGLPNNNVAGILEDNQSNLWISTNNGLTRFDIREHTFRTFTVTDGLPDNTFNESAFYKASNGEMFFGGVNGFTSFLPEHIHLNNNPADIIFTDLKLIDHAVVVNGPDKLLPQSFNATSQLIFSHDQDVFTIEFALLNFIKPCKNKYAYKLEGFDKTWHESNVPAVTYTNLPPGSYTLSVKGANNDGVWSLPTQLKIQVLPPFWKTGWAWCLYIILLSIITFFIVRYFYMRAFLRREDQLHQLKLNFFTNISHEIRTHLTLIMAPVETMLNHQQNDFIRQQLGNVKNNADRLLKLVNELMDFRKAETGHLSLQVASHDLVAFLQDIYLAFQELSVLRQINLSFEHTADKIPAYFDKEQLSKVLFNLLTNAFKFTAPGGGVILKVTSSSTHLCISVTDNGRGISPEYIDKLFYNFFQVADYGIQQTGYGIGLALSKDIVALHKGNLTVTSQPAGSNTEGHTCFTVELLPGKDHFPADILLQDGLPTSAPLPDPLLTESSLPEAPNEQETNNKPFTILLVEDNAGIRAMVREAFHFHYHILECDNGYEGWESATTNIPDLIISDIMMPGMDGYTLCHALKSDERTSHIPVILLTARSEQHDHIKGLETGADIYLTKSFETKILVLHVRNLLASREKMREKFSTSISSPPTDEGNHALAEESDLNAVDKEFLGKVMQYVETYMDHPEFGVTMLAKKVAMSPPILYKKMKAVTGMSVNDFIKSLRLKKAAHLVLQGKLTVSEIAYTVGFNDPKYFSREFKKQFGETPRRYDGMKKSEEEA
ncbi:hybrid sensor histidine kinase/response regulator transcription factor [Chitinophaga sp. RAB17]|uniref:hybrid sensor histidine kinase/response regulator transcription factor n=1 Tax=Chitinophaga sp. RAB17 TaxID=3233049 RepID=UPI003F93A3D4